MNTFHWKVWPRTLVMYCNTKFYEDRHRNEKSTSKATYRLTVEKQHLVTWTFPLWWTAAESGDLAPPVCFSAIYVTISSGLWQPSLSQSLCLCGFPVASGLCYIHLSLRTQRSPESTHTNTCGHANTNTHNQLSVSGAAMIRISTTSLWDQNGKDAAHYLVVVSVILCICRAVKHIPL